MENSQVANQISFKNILFPTDFSTLADLALPYAVEIARRSGAMIHAVHVVQPDVYPLLPPSQWQNAAREEQEFREEKKTQLEKELQGLPHDFLFPAGDIWENLSNVIEEKDIDLIVLGTHGRTGVAKALVGSVAEEVFRQARCPVLTVGPAVTAKATHAAAAEFDRILYATDFGLESLAAAPYAIQLAREHRAELILMHAIQNPEEDQLRSVFDSLRDIVPANANLAIRPRCVVEERLAEDAILGVATRDDADLIVLGVRTLQKHPTLATHVSHSIAYTVVTQAACPVLTVHSWN